MNLPRKVSNRGGLTSKSFTFVCPSPYCKECSENGCDVDVKGSLEAVLGILYCYVFQYVIHNPTCNFLFRCGCTWEWSGGWKDCNIFSQGPKCPWCMSRSYISWTTDYLVFAIMLLTFLFFFLKREKYHPLLCYVAPILTYFISSIIVGFFFILFTDYPYFIVI